MTDTVEREQCDVVMQSFDKDDTYFVLIESGIPVGVARSDRTAATYAWQSARPNRQIVRVTELR